MVRIDCREQVWKQEISAEGGRRAGGRWMLLVHMCMKGELALLVGMLAGERWV